MILSVNLCIMVTVAIYTRTHTLGTQFYSPSHLAHLALRVYVALGHDRSPPLLVSLRLPTLSILVVMPLCIPVPRIQDVFIIEGKTYIVMDYINAFELTYAAKTLSQEQRQGICLQLGEYITPDAYFESPKSRQIRGGGRKLIF